MQCIGKKVIGLLVASLVLISTAAFVPGCNGNGMDGWNEAEFETERNGEFRQEMEEADMETRDVLEEADYYNGLHEPTEELNGDVEFDRSREYYNGDYIERDTGRSEFRSDY